MRSTSSLSLSWRSSSNFSMITAYDSPTFFFHSSSHAHQTERQFVHYSLTFTLVPHLDFRHLAPPCFFLEFEYSNFQLNRLSNSRQVATTAAYRTDPTRQTATQQTHLTVRHLIKQTDTCARQGWPRFVIPHRWALCSPDESCAVATSPQAKLHHNLSLGNNCTCPDKGGHRSWEAKNKHV